MEFSLEEWDRRAQAKRDELALAAEINHRDYVIPRIKRASEDGDYARDCVWESFDRRVAITQKQRQKGKV